MAYTISEQSRRHLEGIVEANDATFSNLSKIGGLDPKLDFRYANLRDVDFRDSDLRGFDFTGSDLLGAIKNSTTKIDETTIFAGAQISWIEGESSNIVDKMIEIQASQSSVTRRKLLAELQEQYRSAEHIRQFLMTSMRKSASIEAFFDYANCVHTSNDASVNMVIREEFRRLVDTRGVGPSRGRRKLAKTPYGLDLILRLLDESINPFLRSVAEQVFQDSSSISRASILNATGGTPLQLI